MVDDQFARLTACRLKNNAHPILHASISCKWTLQVTEARTRAPESTKFVRNQGQAPHIVVVTGEPLPKPAGALALGTGDIDTVYHFA